MNRFTGATIVLTCIRLAACTSQTPPPEPPQLPSEGPTPQSSAEQPFFMMTPRAVESPQASERDRFAQQMLLAFVSNPNLRIVSSEPVRIAGSQGHEIIAETKDKVTGDDLVMVQWLRFGAGVMQMFGMARKDQWTDVLPRMRALRDGFERK